ncbi:MAG: tRNA lysidine(34) synthetase TilS [Chloroflexi bacterium]|nr:tRNA lysidine(34) synthetase TilS [Chloroflexota bacterium]
MAKAMPPLEERVFSYIQAQRLFSEKKVVVGVSGGPDSVCLLHVLHRLRGRLDINIHAAHLNHGLRGAEADADAEYVAGLARSLGLPASIERQDVREYQGRQRLSLEEAAREVRYLFLERIAREAGTGSVAVGHTLDDHVETVLMHLLRGSGAAGLRGLRPVRVWRPGGHAVRVVRPLLEVSHAETAAYCDANGLAPRLDSSNLSPHLLRNRIRQELIPSLASYNPGVTRALVRTARLAADEHDFLDGEAARVWAEVVRTGDGSIALDKELFRGIKPALQRHLLRKAIEALTGSIRDIESRHIEDMLNALVKPAGRSLNLPEGLVFSVGYDDYRLSRGEPGNEPYPPLSGEFSLQAPGRTTLPGWQVETSIVDPTSLECRREMALVPTPESGVLLALLDHEIAGGRLMIRGRRPGDRFQPLGMGRLKKLNRFMIDDRIPRQWRGRVPILTKGEDIIWVAGWRIDERYRVTGETRRVLRIELRRRYE